MVARHERLWQFEVFEGVNEDLGAPFSRTKEAEGRVHGLTAGFGLSFGNGQKRQGIDCAW